MEATSTRSLIAALPALSEAERDLQFTWKSCSAEHKAAFQEAKDQVLVRVSQCGRIRLSEAGSNPCRSRLRG
jgi:hypothetical protein